ncbi:phosphoenolpyruvate synthase [Candidatus Kuenenbacteria bacterium CG11_big_fil_rev_8_21_14_0_20_37_9]|uniref:Phosphoenolpyruvate synthase n=2 Tax=Candidatus Kueneniibacteriota TaxID=1752740 RepID=A0A2M6XT60_9BACT|nr:MAG: phosphoenolpyruvate synthase [Candidatus Kuenenbacteria bacterium CG1_02_38_13]PIR05437.1 MAG: phosphoenolpyruvate synthase [Candidatus Kuenenbacteria bacterium CG11_big_fil_rev_8_21_14_0_20_37_9]PIU10830.1 MAG: phosphoenolpyruvate synthase [Candidatus Kuenenbacteria bacterium CG08_land_8_20_14_0_20_37_23]
MVKSKKFILFFEELRNIDVPCVGGKNASLGEMYFHLAKNGVRVPNGFALTAYAYRYFLEQANIKKEIKNILKDLDTRSVVNLRARGKKVRNLILRSRMPIAIEKEVYQAYKKLLGTRKNLSVAVRSSATAEDLPDASFAGQQETYLNIKGEKKLLLAVKKCIASLFTDRSISYREDKHFDHFAIALSVGVQIMVRSDKGTSGVMFTADTESGFKNLLIINASYGLGEYVVKGEVTPDEYRVFQSTFDFGFPAIISKKIGVKTVKLVYSGKTDNPTKREIVSSKDRNRFCLSDEDVLQLASWGVVIEKHYKKSMDIEWAKDGLTGELYIVQARPETVHFITDGMVLREYKFKGSPEKKIIIKGTSVGNRIGSGNARVIMDARNMKIFQPGEVLVTDVTDPDWEPIMKIAGAIVTEKGGRTCHAAIVSRELGIPCIVGTGNASKIIKTGQSLTVSCAEGQTGYVYEGILQYEIKTTNLKKLKKSKTRIMMNIGVPENAFTESLIPNDGVGLAREEFIINSYIGIHPNALINYSKLKDAKIKKQIGKLIIGYKDKKQFFVDKLAEGVGQIAAAFYPRDVIVRLSDFKTNEYSELIGGREFEPIESNPMIGWRGASRYYSENFKEAFRLECLALKKAREEFGLDNIIVMVPFCRTTEEAAKVLSVMRSNGLTKGEKIKVKKNSFKTKRSYVAYLKPLRVYCMIEIPSNVILIDEFAEYFDGFSIGSNDLTQLTLGLDRDAGTLAHIGDERNKAVKILISIAIQSAKKHKKKIGICGQGPSDFPDFAEFLVREGIDSISLNPDTVISTTLKIVETEKKLKKL